MVSVGLDRRFPVCRTGGVTAQEYSLGIRDRFIFSKVMTDKNLCIQVLRCLTGNDIEDIGDITAEKYFQITNDGKGVRYDVYVEDVDDRAYDAEMHIR